MVKNLPAWAPDFTVFVLLTFLLFWGLSDYGLFNNNEGLYARIPVEMLETGDFVIPHLNGGPYIEKPPMLYWLTAMSYHLFGVSAWAARLVPALAGFCLCALLRLTLPLITSPQSARIACLILGTSVGFLVFPRMVFFDVVFSFFLSSALLFFYIWREQGRALFLRLSYGALACAILTKGFLAVVLYGLVVLCSLRTFATFRGLFSPSALFILIGIAAPWHLLAHTQDPDFSYFYFINEHILRFLGQREPHDYYRGPLYYYLPRITLYMLPWIPFLGRRPQSSFPQFLWTWTLVFLTFFSLSQAKANYYVVTMMPPLAILCALHWPMIWEKAWIRQLIYTLVILLPLSLVCLGCDFIALPPKALAYSLATLVPLWIAVLWLITNSASIILRLNPLVMLSLQSIPLLLLLLNFAATHEDQFSARALVAQIPVTERTKPTYLYRDFEKMSSVVFYWGRALPMIDSQSNDLLYAIKRVPQMNVPAKEVKRGYIFVFHEQERSFAHDFPKASKIASSGPVTLYQVG